MEELRCPHCGAVMDDDQFGLECVPYGRIIVDVLGQKITSHRFGICTACWHKVELINGEIANSILYPSSNG